MPVVNLQLINEESAVWIRRRRDLFCAAGFWLATLVMLAQVGLACNWDTETLLQERSRFPTALEIIVGKFPRHSKDYYQWRLEDRLEKLESRPNDDLLLDDIAVSYEKLERYDEAIDVAQEQLKRTPDRYESLANLGTFLIHSGQLQEGLSYIEKAIEVNPDAHFGREKYQVIVVKYVLARSTSEGVQFPLGSSIRFPDQQSRFLLPFRGFLEQELATGSDGHLTKEQFEEAVKGILGMMRFSRHDSPILLEILGELQEALSARQLAYRAYKSAAQQVKDPVAKERYEQLASHVLDWSLESWRQSNGVKITESDIANAFAAEQADADAWFRTLASDERQWIVEGEAVDERFNEKYRQLPEAIATDPATERESHSSGASPASSRLHGLVALCVVLVLAIASTLAVFWARHRRMAGSHLNA